MDSIKRQARWAGALYVLMGVTAPLGLLYVPGKLFVTGDATATAERIRASATLLRLGMASEIFHQVVFIFLAAALYQLLKSVNARQALLLLILAVLSAPIVLLSVVGELGAQTLASGATGAPGASFLSAFDRPQLDALAYLFVRLHSYGIKMAVVFWGLWLFPFGLLVLRAGFLPRVLGWFLLAAGAGWVLNAAVFVLLPQYSAAAGQASMILGVGELPMQLYLLIWGAREQPATRAEPAYG